MEALEAASSRGYIEKFAEFISNSMQKKDKDKLLAIENLRAQNSAEAKNKFPRMLFNTLSKPLIIPKRILLAVQSNKQVFSIFKFRTF